MKSNFPIIRSLTFWHYQIPGWIFFYISDLFIMLVIRKSVLNEVIQETIEFIIGFLLTSILRLYYHRIRFLQMSIWQIGVRALIGSFTVAFVWYLTTYFFVALLIPDQLSIINSLLAGVHYTIAVAWLIIPWSAIYFGIKFWMAWGEEKERAEKAEHLAQNAQLQMLQYQAHPHFLFNALNSIRALTTDDAPNAKVMITELSEFLRYSLLNRAHDHTTVKEELDAVRHYLSIEKRRFEDKIDITFDIDPSVEQYSILSFLIHPLVENAIKHGMRAHSLPLRIRIAAVPVGDTVKISVSNSGKWLDNTAGAKNDGNSTGTGLENVRARLENAFPGSYVFKVVHENGWVHVIIEIPRNGASISAK